MIQETDSKTYETLQFYSQLCRFDYFRDLARKQEMQANPELDEQNDFHHKNNEFESIPLRFPSENSYIATWKKLFIDELKAYITSAKVSDGTHPEKYELTSYFELGDFKIMEFQRYAQSHINYFTGTLVLLSPQNAIGKDVTQPHLLGIVYKNENSLYVRTILNKPTQQSKNDNWTIFTTSKLWYIQGLCSISSLQRQYRALLKFDSLNPLLKQIILKPNLHNKEVVKKFQIPEKLQKKLKQTYNQSQFQAISQCLKQEGFTLIQGPPGTGKTKTVLGTISVLLHSFNYKDQNEEIPLILSWKKSQQLLKNHSTLNPWMNSGFKDWRDQPFVQDDESALNLTKFYLKSEITDRQIKMQKKIQDAKTPGKVLICGPSNASVDEIIRKLISQKLIDKDGLSYLPQFVRVGQNYHESLQEYSIDYIANKLLRTDKTKDLAIIKKNILHQYRLVFATLSASGSSLIESSEVQFDTVVIDEAGQSIEISNLIPLMYKCQRVILIGDPNQLPATVFSTNCLTHHYDQSLFERFMKAQYPVNILKIQYRMHPQISRVISSAFYGNIIQNSSHLMYKEQEFIPSSFLMFHLNDSFETFHDQSYQNTVEAECVKLIADYFLKQYKDIGIVSPYSAQIKYLNSLGLDKNCEVRTVDSFQGRQKTVIIFSPVRSSFVGKKRHENKKKSIGFVSDKRRINVSLSRAKNICVVVGDLKRLRTSRVWRGIIDQAAERGKVFNIENRKLYFKDWLKNWDDYVLKSFEK